MPDALLAPQPDLMDDAHTLLKQVWGFDRFRPGQEEIVAAIVEGRDVLAIMPTGAGKSLCYQLPALMRPGLTVVVSPLIALMRDQVAALQANGVAAGALTSNTDPHEAEAIYQMIDTGTLKLLFMAPERLSVAGGLLRRAGISMLAIDEAHCVSQWGHDFRPDYLRIGELRDALRAEGAEVQITAFTATADEETRGEIASKLFSDAPQVFLGGFDRPNLFLAFEPKAQAKTQVTDFVLRHEGEAGIVYCSSRAKTEQFAEHLQKKGIEALAYHAGLDAETRQVRQDRFTREDGIVICATVAFGMGIDKPDVRFVVHADLPKSMEAYYQEVGRAGRDGLPADTLTLYGVDDIKLRRLQIDDSDAPDARRRADHQRLNALLSLAEAPRCRRQVLLAFFGEREHEPCGNCDLCKSPVETFDGTEDAQKALSAMVRTGERFGLEHIISILRGEDTERVRTLRHDQLPTYGVGAHYDKHQWRDLCRQLYALGLTAVDAQYGSWLVTEAGWAVLKAEAQVALRHPPAKQARRARGSGSAGATGRGGRKAQPQVELSERDMELLRALKEKRTDLAQAQNVPAYVIFPDKTLIEMAMVRPSNLDQMAEIGGVGARKLEKYGAVFLDVVRKQG
ncbi:DNA helicase RecQ [Pyruvatibacter mobilis]|uniref:DNA helicase RecQ n=1 Tax=Pyruvatibacter mobilis TaxID=1712261 RepID=UPI003D13D117